MLYVNHAYARRHGRAPLQLIGVNLFDLIPDDATAFVRDIWRRAADVDHGLCVENQVEFANGEVRWISWTNRAIRDVGGEVTAIFSVGRDINERVVAEQKLKASRDHFRQVYKKTPALLHSIDASGKLRSVSDAWLAKLGYAREEVIGRLSTDFLTPESRARATGAKIPDLFRTGCYDKVEYQMVAKDGAVLDIELSAVLVQDENDGMMVSLAAFTDVTSQKLAERRLLESELNFRTLALSTSDVLSKLSLDGSWTYIAPTCETALGYRAESLLGQKPAALLHDEDRGPFVALMDAMAFGATADDRAVSTFRMRHADGNWIWFEGALTLVRHPSSGRPSSIICSMRDVSERQKAAQALRQAYATAEAAGRAKAEFVANVSHELRTPLTGILGVLDILRSDSSLRDDHARLVEIALQSGKSLKAIVDDVLDFSKIDAGRLTIECVAFNLDDLLRSCQELALSGRDGKALTIVRKSDSPELGEFLGDPVRIRQVIQNLLTNAIKFTHEGHVTISSTYRESAGVLRVQVSDSGIGIPAERISMLFDRFTQADSSMTRRYGGTGLGLAICRQLVELMGGHIGAENCEEGGAAFWFELPLKRGSARRASANAARPAPAAAVRRILLAEDNPFNAEVIATMLTSRGHEVLRVANGAEAVAQARSQKFDLILMDLQMPELDGLQAAREIRAEENQTGRERIPIIGLTANAMPSDKQDCLSAGMDAHVAKPIGWETLSQTIARFARSGGSPEAIGAPASPVVLELTRLEELSQVMGRERVAAMLREFIDDLWTRLALLDGNAANLTAQMHDLVSTSGQFGFVHLSRLCAEIEQQARLGQGRERLADLRRAAREAADAMRQIGFTNVQ